MTEDTSVFVWTQRYRPFTMGGDVHRPIGTRLEPAGPAFECRGVRMADFELPSGRRFVAVLSSGAIVGNSQQMVEDDLRGVNMAVVLEQLSDAAEQAEKADTVPADEFDRLYTQ